MNNTYDYAFGPDRIRLTNSITFERFLSGKKSTINQEKAQTICKAILQLQSVNKKPFVLERLKGSTFDFWNLYLNDKIVFCVSEAGRGYTLRFFDDTHLDDWFDAFCALAHSHSGEFGRNGQ